MLAADGGVLGALHGFGELYRLWVDAVVAELVAGAVAEGDVRADVDPSVTSRLLFGMVNSLVEWYRPKPDHPVGEVADALVAIAFDGLRRS